MTRRNSVSAPPFATAAQLLAAQAAELIALDGCTAGSPVPGLLASANLAVGRSLNCIEMVRASLDQRGEFRAQISKTIVQSAELLRHVQVLLNGLQRAVGPPMIGRALADLDTDREAFVLRQTELEAQHWGKWVLFYDGELIGVFS